VRRLGKRRLAKLLARHCLLRKAFAALLLDAYSDYSGDEGEEGRAIPALASLHGAGEETGAEAGEETEAEAETEREAHTTALQQEQQTWVYGLDAEGRPYYYNTLSGASQWEPPIFSTADGTWSRRVDEHGQEFWLNSATGVSSWELPPEEYQAD
jgi:hypothetical protein